MKRILGIVAVLLSIASIFGVTVSAAYDDYTMAPGQWYYSPQIDQGSDTTASGTLTNNDSSSSGTGTIEVIHIETGFNSTVCDSTEFLSTGGDYVSCSVSEGSIANDVNQSKAIYSTQDTGGNVDSRVEVK